MSSPASLFRDQLISACAALPPASTLLLSGGLDSGVILAAMVAAGRTDFDVVTMQFGQYPSEDNRGAKARHEKVAPHIPFRTIEIVRDPNVAIETIDWTINRARSVLKTSIEVMVLVKPVLDSLADEGAKAVINGMTGGLLWGVSREGQILRRKQGEAAWTAQRRFDLEYDRAGYPPVATRLGRLRCQELGIAWIDPLMDLAELMLSLGYDDLNRPKEKSLAAKAFPELADSFVITGGLQVKAGVREYMEVLARDAGYSSSILWYNYRACLQDVKLRGDDVGRAWWDQHAVKQGFSVQALEDARADLRKAVA